jgi:hypothetical protein
MSEQLSKEGPINVQKIFNIFNHQGYENQNTLKFHATPVRKAIIKKTKKTNKC